MNDIFHFLNSCHCNFRKSKNLFFVVQFITCSRVLKILYPLATLINHTEIFTLNTNFDKGEHFL